MKKIFLFAHKKTIGLALAGLIMVVFLIHFWIKQSIETFIAHHIEQTLQDQSFISNIEYETTNAGLFALLKQSYTLYNLTLTFNDPHFNTPLRIHALSIKHPEIDPNNHLVFAEIVLQGVELQKYINRLNETSSLATYFIKTIAQHERPLLLNAIVMLNQPSHQLHLQTQFKRGKKIVFKYETDLDSFDLSSTSPNIESLYSAFKQAQTAGSRFEFNFAADFLDPKLTAPFPIIQTVAKEMGYYSLKGSIHLKGESNLKTHLQQTSLHLKIEDALALDLTASLTHPESNQNSTLIPEAPLLPIVFPHIISAETKIYNLGLVQRALPITKIYFGLGKEQVLTSLTSLKQAQTSTPLKKALDDVIAFIQQPHELTMTLNPAQPFDPSKVISELKLRNQHNFEQYQQEMVGVANDDARKKVTEFFSFKQDESLTQTLTQIGFSTQHRLIQ